MVKAVDTAVLPALAVSKFVKGAIGQSAPAAQGPLRLIFEALRISVLDAMRNQSEPESRARPWPSQAGPSAGFMEQVGVDLVARGMAVIVTGKTHARRLPRAAH